MDSSFLSSPRSCVALVLLLLIQPTIGKAQVQESRGVLDFSFQSESQGLVVTGVIPGGAADRAGLRKGDVIVQFNGVSGDANRLLAAIRSKKPVGSRCTISYLRGQARAQVEIPTVEALSLYKQGASEGSPVAQDALGDLYFRGDGVPKDLTEGVRWYRKAAEQGFADGQYNLGRAYFNGVGVQKDVAESIQWFRRAADQGHLVSEDIMGAVYFNGDSGVRKDLTEGVHWYRKAAKQGYSVSQFYLGYAYYTGQGVPKDTAQGVRWYRKAAEQGYAQAEYHLGIAYRDGQGVAKDPAEGVQWFRKAAEQGDEKAQNNLGVAYFTGQGIPKDLVEGVRWYRKAAERGNETAEENLAAAYYDGSGVSRDYVSAYLWFSVAAARGNNGAKQSLAKLDGMKALDSGLRAEAERRASSWKAYLNRTSDPEAPGVAAEQGGRLREALAENIRALQSFPDPPPFDADRRVRERIIKIVAELNPPPALPEDAVRHAAYAQAALEKAARDTNSASLADSANEFQTALRIAPWWADAYFNLAAVLKKAQRPGEAAQALQLYLLANPKAENAQDVKMELYKLEYEAKKP